MDPLLTQQINISKNALFVFIPGLGDDARLFERQLSHFDQSVCLPWIPILKNEKMGDYGTRLAHSFQRPQGTEDRPLIICGLSLGGMLAPFVAQELKADGCVILSSVKKPSQLSNFYRKILYLPNHCAVFSLTTHLLGKILILLAWPLLMLLASRNFRSSLRQYLDSNSQWYQRAMRMIFTWQDEDAFDFSSSRFTTLQIHGTRDFLVFPQAVSPDLFIRDGRHLLMAHWKKLNRSLQIFAEQLRKRTQAT